MEPIKLVKYALDSTVALIAKGEHPTSALEKVARELELNTNYIQRTGEALNVALHYDHFKKVASADKAKEFPVADIPGVQKNIFGAKEKTLAQKKAEWFPKATLDIDYNSYLTNPAFKEQTNNILKTAANFDSFKTSLTGQYKKAAEYIDVLNKTIDKLKTEKVSHDTYLESSFNNLVKHFKKEAAARTAFHEFESQAYSAHGKRVAPYLDLIYKTAQLKEARGTHDDKYFNFESCHELNLLNSMLKAGENTSLIKEKIAYTQDFITAQKCRFKDAGYKIHAAGADAEKQLADDIDLFFEKEAGVVSKSLIEELFHKLRNPTGGSSGSPIFKNTSSDNRERVAMLQDLIMTDPILKKQDPRKIINCYQQLLRLGPHIAKEKEVVRGMLKAMTAADSLGPMEANQWLETNSNYLKQHKMITETSGGDNKKDK